MKNNFKFYIVLVIFGVVFIGLWFLIFKEKNTSEGGIRQKAINITFKDINNKAYKLSDFKGKKIMLWFIATWCPSCIEGAKVLVQNKDLLKDITIITLKTFNNAGRKGPSIEEFINTFIQEALGYKNFIFGEADKNTSLIYNPKDLPDIYYLIDKNFEIKKIGIAPSVTLKEIISFVKDN